MVQFTKIEKQPLNNNYMLFAQMINMYPFYGTLKECKNMQPIWEQKLNDEFSKLPKERQKEFLSERKRIYKF